jgi:plasmid stabilization system protein ParE
LASYLLSKDAENDIREIVRYTLRNWGETQVNLYRSALRNQFDKIGKNVVVCKHYSKTLPDVKFTIVKEHFVFYVSPPNEKPIIIAVLHKSRDMVRHLSSRSKGTLY